MSACDDDQIVVELYKASSLEELNVFADLNESCLDSLGVNSLLTARKVWSAAHRELGQGDHEMAYVLFMRTFALTKHIFEKSKAMSDDSFDRDLHEMSEDAVKMAGELSNRLKERYDNQKIKRRLQPPPQQPPDLKIVHVYTKPLLANETTHNHHQIEWIEPSELESLLKKDPHSVLLIQIRTSAEVNASTFSGVHNSCVCIDRTRVAEMVKPAFKELCSAILSLLMMRVQEKSLKISYDRPRREYLDDRERNIMENSLRKFQNIVILEQLAKTKASEIVLSTLVHRLPAKVGHIQKSPRFLRGGFVQFQLTYPYKCVGRPSIMNGELNEIAPPRQEEVQTNHDTENVIAEKPIRPPRNNNGLYTPPHGLPNLGNTCFLNTAVQCLASVDIICTYFINDQFKQDLKTDNKTEGTLSPAFADILRHIRPHYGKPPRSNAREVATRLKNALAKLNPVYGQGNQEDAFEALLEIVNSCHNELNRAKSATKLVLPDEVRADPLKMWTFYYGQDDSFFVQLFDGLIEYTTNCSECGNVSVSYEIFANLTLVVVDMDTLEECLENSLSDEEVELSCSKCEKINKAIRRQRLHSLPPVLLVLLSRYSMTRGHFSKVTNLVQFSTDTLIIPAHLVVNNKPATYELVSVCNHTGFMYGGHYTAHCKQPDGHWYQCNDSFVCKVDPVSVVSSGAYALIYKARK